MRYVFLETKTNLKIIYVAEVHVYDTWNVHVISVTNTPNNVKPSSNLVMIKTSTVLKNESTLHSGYSSDQYYNAKLLATANARPVTKLNKMLFSQIDRSSISSSLQIKVNRKKTFKVTFFVSITRYEMRGIQNSNFRTQMRYCSYRFKLPRKKISQLTVSDWDGSVLVQVQIFIKQVWQVEQVLYKCSRRSFLFLQANHTKFSVVQTRQCLDNWSALRGDTQQIRQYEA